MQILVNIRFLNGIELYLYIEWCARVLLKYLGFFQWPGTGSRSSVCVCVWAKCDHSQSIGRAYGFDSYLSIFACDMLYVGMWNWGIHESCSSCIRSYRKNFVFLFREKWYRHLLVSQCVTDFWDFLSCLSFHLLCSFVWFLCIRDGCTDAVLLTRFVLYA